MTPAIHPSVGLIMHYIWNMASVFSSCIYFTFFTVLFIYFIIIIPYLETVCLHLAYEGSVPDDVKNDLKKLVKYCYIV